MVTGESPVVPKGKGTDRRGNKSLQMVDYDRLSITERESFTRQVNGTFPEYKVIGMTAVPLGNIRITEEKPAEKPIETKPSAPIIHIEVEYRCGCKGTIPVEVKLGLTLPDILAAHKAILCEHHNAEARKHYQKTLKESRKERFGCLYDD